MMELLAAIEKGQDCHVTWSWTIFGIIFSGSGECALFVSLTNQMQSLNEQAHTFAFDILFSQLKQKLSKVPHLKVGVTMELSRLI